MDKNYVIYYEGKKLELKHLLNKEIEKEKTAEKNICYLKNELKQTTDKLNAI